MFDRISFTLCERDDGLGAGIAVDLGRRLPGYVGTCVLR
jgi:hypothetical protein